MDEILKILERHPTWVVRIETSPSQKAWTFTVRAEENEKVFANQCCVSFDTHKYGKMDVIAHELKRIERHIIETITKDNPTPQRANIRQNP